MITPLKKSKKNPKISEGKEIITKFAALFASALKGPRCRVKWLRKN